MGVYKRKQKHGTFWRYDKMVNGVRLSSAYLYPSKAKAEEAEREAIQNFLHPKPKEPEKTDMAFWQLCEKRLDWLQNHRGKRHYQQNKWICRRMVGHWGDLPADKLTTDMVIELLEEWAAELAETGKDKYSLNAAIRCGQTLYNHPWGKRRGHRANRTFSVNPFASVDWYSVEKRGKYVPSQQVVSKILMAADPTEKVLITLLKDTGARINEALSSQWIHVNLQDKWIDLFTRKKADGSLTPRRIGYSNELRKLLHWWRKRNPRGEYVFQSDRKDHQPFNYTWARNAQKKLCQRAGVEYFSLHSWRHYYTSMLVSIGYDLAKIQAPSGHENVRTTGIYVHAIAGLEVGESL